METVPLEGPYGKMSVVLRWTDLGALSYGFPSTTLVHLLVMIYLLYLSHSSYVTSPQPHGLTKPNCKPTWGLCRPLTSIRRDSLLRHVTQMFGMGKCFVATRAET